jgi:asparagine synthetase B (glutamine-hydrolysing)
MCGIFGVVCASDQRTERELTRQLIVTLLKSSETRGREAVGVAVNDGARIEVLKQPGSVTAFLRNARFHELLDGAIARPTKLLAFTGHSRLATNGTQANHENNQPVIARGSVTLHNGIVVNDRALLERYPQLAPRGDLDSEVLARILRMKLDERGDLVAATRETFGEISGSASIAMMFNDLDKLLLATNTGSLFQITNPQRTIMAFASERFILQRVLEDRAAAAQFTGSALEQIKAGHAQAVDLQDLDRRSFSLVGSDGPSDVAPNGHHLEIVDHSSTTKDLKRCTKCVLPETYPFVEFDERGVCRYCREWVKVSPKGEKALFDAVEPYRSKDGSPDVIVALSGGRDSSYGLHYVKKVLGMNPVAFTYDWGMVTDLARRNQARVCGALGIEHIVRSADIIAKRRYIRKNLEAWLKKPELGMVTLLMAGDKEFYAHARQLRNETGIKLVIFCTGNMIEDAPYKVGFMGFPQDDHKQTLTGMTLRNKVAMLSYFAKNYATNPGYINESLRDTWNAFWQTFVVKDDFLYLFHYLEWRENEIVGTIRREYDWEVATDTTTTWRIGDGTAAFYNYVYQTIAGFTEDEAMLSNMVREGHIDRAEALSRAIEYSKPRWPSIREYADLIGFNLEEALQVINAVPKLY